MADIPVNTMTANSGPATGGAAVARPSVLSLPIKEKAALYAAYMPYLTNGGIFVPTNRKSVV